MENKTPGIQEEYTELSEPQFGPQSGTPKSGPRSGDALNETPQAETQPTPKLKSIDGVATSLNIITVAVAIFAIIILGRIVYIWFFYHPSETEQKSYTQRVEKRITEPVRGAILTHDGKILSASVPFYDIHMDCTVQKKDLHDQVASGKQKIKEGEALIAAGKKKRGESLDRTGEKRVQKAEDAERVWRANADTLGMELAQILGTKSAKEWSQLIRRNRDNNGKYVLIARAVDYETLRKIQACHLFRGGKLAGGIIVETVDKRVHPYGNLARKLIGEVAKNDENNALRGLEGKFDYALRGKEGVEYMKLSEHRQMVPDFDSTSVKVENGMDVRTTINIEIQDIVDDALRKKILARDYVEGGCAIVMDVKTGAIRAMVNLSRNKDGVPSEIYNSAIQRLEAPGSVCKLATLMTLLDDGKVKSLEQTVSIPQTAVMNVAGHEFKDDYLPNWRTKHSTDRISIKDAFKISSNNVFRHLVVQHYGDNPKSFTDKLFSYGLGDVFKFDLDGLGKPNIMRPGEPSWSGTALPSIAIGYSITETPLHIVTFYNAVANKGKMMKPYLVESLERNGKAIETFEPVVLNGAICSKATADTLLRALCAVTETEGTGAALMKSQFKVAGKTGTAQIPFYSGGKLVTKDAAGNRKHQATFVGFFPAEAPKYTAIVVMYSKLSTQNLYGSYGVEVFQTIVDNIYALSPDWEEPLKKVKD